MATSTQTFSPTLARPRNGGLGGLLKDTWTLYRRAIIRMTRAPAQLYFSLVQPLIWFLLFGQVFSRLTSGFSGSGNNQDLSQAFGQAGTSYQAFFLPAIIIQMMLFGSAGSALGIINDDQSGYLNKLRVAPINRFAILFGGLLSDLTRMLIQVAVLLVFGFIMGVRFAEPWLIPLGFVIAALFGLLMGGLGLIIGLKTRNTQATFLIINFFTLPLLFTSSAQLPTSFLPDWLQTVAHLNPLTYAINGFRVIVTGLNIEQVRNGDTTFGVIGLALLILFVLVAVVMGIATRMFGKQIAA